MAVGLRLGQVLRHRDGLSGRLQVIAATTPGVIYTEQHIPAPFAQVWAVASDLETQLPRIIIDVRTFQITASASGCRHAPAAASACAPGSTWCCAPAGA